MLRPCGPGDEAAILEVIDAAARAYQGVIPADRWHDPYMSAQEISGQAAEGVEFWGWEEEGRLQAVMGIQHAGDVTLIRHAYVRTERRRQGLGSRLLAHLRTLSDRPMLVGTWADAAWAVRFYERHGFTRLPRGEGERLLGRYWRIPRRQVETSVVLADRAWLAAAARRTLLPAWAAAAAAVAALSLLSAWAQGRLPADARVAVHWGLDGRPDGWAPPGPALWTAPVLALALSLLLGLAARLDPRLAASRASLRAYRALWMGLLALLCLVQAALVAQALGRPAPMARLVLAGVGGLLALTGALLPRLEPNGVIGIRTPGTLADPDRWRAVHAAAGPWFLGLGGALALAAALDLPPPWLFGLLLGGLALATAASLRAKKEA